MMVSTIPVLARAESSRNRGASGDSLPTSGASRLHRTILYAGKVDTATTFWCSEQAGPLTLTHCSAGPTLVVSLSFSLSGTVPDDARPHWRRCHSPNISGRNGRSNRHAGTLPPRALRPLASRNHPIPYTVPVEGALHLTVTRYSLLRCRGGTRSYSRRLRSL